MASAVFPVTPAAVALPTLALFVLLIDTPAFVWYIKARNLAASSLVFWILLANVMNFINPLIWPTDNIDDWWYGYGLCDIEVKLQVAMWLGIVGSVVCVMRNLAQVLDTEHTTMSPSPAQRRRQIAITCLYCFGGPIYAIAIHFIVQPTRYFIYAISGCTASFAHSWPKVPLVLIWPPVLCVVAVYYSILVILRMHRYRKNFSEVLLSANSNQTKSRFLRLFRISIVLILVVFPAEVYVLYESSAVPMGPYRWSDVHGPTWWDIIPVPSGGTVLFDRWMQIGAGLVLFIFFGLGQDAKAMYRRWLVKIGLGRLFPCLRSRAAVQQQGSSTTSSESRFFGKRFSKLSRFSFNSRSVSTSANTSSPEPPEDFDQLPIISDAIQPISRSSWSGITSPDEREASTTVENHTMSWLDHFIVRTHLSATNHQWFARPQTPAVRGLGLTGANTEGIDEHSTNSSALVADV